MEAPLNPPAPGERGGLADDKTPVSEAPFTETSAQGAANVVQIYYALLEAKKYEPARSEEHTSELQSLMRISYAVFCLKKKTHMTTHDPIQRSMTQRYTHNKSQ